MRHSYLEILSAISVSVIAGTNCAFAEDPLPVEIVTSERAAVVRSLKVVGAVEAIDSFQTSFRRGGQIIDLNAHVGDQIPAGTVIARIDPANILAELDAAHADLEAAKAALVQAEQARDRTVSMLERGVGTQAQYDAAQQNFLSSEATRDQALALLETAEQAMRDSEIIADQDVTVIDHYADLGEVVSAGSAILTVAPDGQRQAVFLAPDAAGLSRVLGHPVSLDPAGAITPFEAVVTEVLPVLTETGTVEIHVQIPESHSDAIPIGTSITGNLELVSEALILLPWTALNAGKGHSAVWVVDPETWRVALTPVEIAAYGDDTVEIASGISEGALVVGGGSNRLFDGRKVIALETQK